MAAEKKLVGSTGSPLGKAGERCEGVWGMEGWRSGRSKFYRGGFDWPLRES